MKYWLRDSGWRYCNRSQKIFKSLKFDSDKHSMCYTNCMPTSGNQKSDYIGGGTNLLIWDIISPYIVSENKNWREDSTICYVDYLQNIKENLGSYLSTEFVYAQIPLNILFQYIPINQSQKIAALYGLSPGSKSNINQLILLAEDHKCDICNTHIAVFSVIAKPHKNNYERLKRCRQKSTNVCLKANQDLLDNDKVSFPPNSLDSNSKYDILKAGCQNMSKENFEGAGCAVYGELKLIKNMSRLESVKNFLNILISPGVIHIE